MITKKMEFHQYGGENMKNKEKKKMSVALSALLIAGAFSAAGCKKAPDTEETLDRKSVV